MRTYSSGSGWFHADGATQSPISPPPMKSVTNSNRDPFHVKRKGHDDGLRSSSVIGRTGARSVVDGGVSAWMMPEGHSTRTASAAVLEPRPKMTSAGETAGEPDAVSIV